MFRCRGSAIDRIGGGARRAPTTARSRRLAHHPTIRTIATTVAASGGGRRMGAGDPRYYLNHNYDHAGGLGNSMCSAVAGLLLASALDTRARSPNLCGCTRTVGRGCLLRLCHQQRLMESTQVRGRRQMRVCGEQVPLLNEKYELVVVVP